MTFAVDALPDLLSLEVCAALVKAGLRAPWKNGAAVGDPQVFTLDVLGASNTSPIIVTVPANSFTVSDAAIGVRTPDARFAGRVIHVVVSGVLGNTAANKLDPETLRNGAWHGVITSATTIALYDLDNSTGAPIASVGNGTYTGGGTLERALLDGRILKGREFVAEESFPPKIVFVPASLVDEPSGGGGAMNASAFADGEHEREQVQRSIRTQLHTWEVHCWGPAPGGAFGPTLALSEAVKRAAHKRGAAFWTSGRTDWRDQHQDAEQRVKAGHWLTFSLGLRFPLTLEAVELAASDLAPLLTLSLVADDGTPEEA